MLRLFLGETIEDFYKDSECNTVLNSSQLKVASLLICNRTHTNISLIAYNDPLLVDPEDSRKQGRYPLPLDFLSLKDVQILDGTDWYPLQHWDYDEYKRYARSISGGRPTSYKVEFGAVVPETPVAGDLWFYPYPDKPYTAQVAYYQKPTAMDDDGDTSELMESGHLAVVYHAAMILSRKGKDRALVAEMGALYAEEVEMLKDLVGKQDQTGDVRMKNYYGDDCGD